MYSIVIALFIGLLSLAGEKLVVGKVKILGLRLLARTGMIFLLVGAIVGPGGLALFDNEVWNKLTPVEVIGLGWIGFLYGSHLDTKIIRKFPRNLFLLALTEAITTLVVILTIFYFITILWPRFGRLYPIITWLFFAICCSGTAPASLFILRQERPIQGPNYEVLRFCAAIDDLPGLIVLGVIFAFNQSSPISSAPIPSTILWMIIQIFLGITVAILIHNLVLLDPNNQAASSVILFGTIGFSSGLCAYIKLSPLFVGMITGFTFVNYSIFKERVYKSLTRREHLFYIVFLILAGGYWNVLKQPSWPLALLLILARLSGKIVGVSMGKKFLATTENISPVLGAGLISQGGMTIAMVINSLWIADSELLLGPVLLSVLINEVLAPWATVNILKKQGET